MRILIIIMLIPAALITSLIYCQTYSSITYGSGTTIEIQTGADVCANDIYINGTYSGGGTICKGALPVTLLSFSFSIDKRTVKLSWITGTEINNSGFDIERHTLSGVEGWTKIAFVKGSGTVNEPKNYSFEDKKLNTGKYSYRLKQIDYNGSYEYFVLNEDVVVKPPGEYSVSQNYPNPSNPRSKIDYQLPVTAKINIRLYDLLGREVIELVNEVKEPGYYTAEFDGSNFASGVYFYKLVTGEYVKIKKMVLVK